MQNEGLLNHKGHRTQTKMLGHMHFSVLKIQNFHKVLTKSTNQENFYSGKNMGVQRPKDSIQIQVCQLPQLWTFIY